MSTNISLTPEHEEYVRKQVKNGFYVSISEFVRETIREHCKRNIEYQLYLRQELTKGLNQLEAGEVMSYDLGRIKRDALDKIKSGNHSVKDSVKP